MGWINWLLLVRLKVQEQGETKDEILRRSIGTCWPNNITALELIKATEDRELWKHVTADLVLFVYLFINQSISKNTVYKITQFKTIKQMYGLNGQHRGVPLTCSQKHYSTFRCNHSQY